MTKVPRETFSKKLRVEQFDLHNEKRSISIFYQISQRELFFVFQACISITESSKKTKITRGRHTPKIIWQGFLGFSKPFERIVPRGKNSSQYVNQKALIVPHGTIIIYISEKYSRLLKEEITSIEPKNVFHNTLFHVETMFEISWTGKRKEQKEVSDKVQHKEITEKQVDHLHTPKLAFYATIVFVPRGIFLYDTY